MGTHGGARGAVTALVAATATVACAALAGCSTPPLPLVPPGQASTSPVVKQPPAQEVVVGVDQIGSGFNPHTLADLAPVSNAIADLVLPSAFQQRPDGQWQLDDTLLNAAEVTDSEPFTVTYRIRHNAQWSDTAPIAAEDFEYLADQMRTQPGVVDSAGYQLIDHVVSRDGGKTAEVVFRRPYTAWRTLFRHLLPAHLLKDAPGGWNNGLDGGIGVSGGPFAVTSVDTARGEMTLTRNDRYWDTPAGVDRILLREGSDAELVDALGSGGVQAALFGHPNAITEELLRAAKLPDATTTVVRQPVVSSVLLRPSSTVLDDQRVRTAVAAALDRPSLIATGVASGPSSELRADAQVLAPSAPGYRATAPAAGPPVRPDPGLTRQLLTDAGFTQGEQGWERAGQPLRLVVAAAKEPEPYAVLATRVAAQLRAAGIQVDLRLTDPDDLFGNLLVPADKRTGSLGSASFGSSGPAADIAVVPQPAAGDPGTELASWSGCPLVVPAKLEPAPPNPAGLCDVSLQPAIEQALVGGDPVGSIPPEVEPALWQLMVTVPLYQQTSLLVTTGRVRGVQPGTPLEGPFEGAARWQLRR